MAATSLICPDCNNSLLLLEESEEAFCASCHKTYSIWEPPLLDAPVSPDLPPSPRRPLPMPWQSEAYPMSPRPRDDLLVQRLDWLLRFLRQAETGKSVRKFFWSLYVGYLAVGIVFGMMGLLDWLPGVSGSLGIGPASGGAYREMLRQVYHWEVVFFNFIFVCSIDRLTRA